ncbi:M23 family metallopeptidase [Ramlibacter sp. USB13]|uniref:M23 family metallopeptidase n=1 Tax=Ramlibacter cellulosilyticus TaxID=2764187 RepID=A0A923MRH9_9BURK|nr:M23 family metallopeptidase [Ramlibacter cellulosilyticus]MBC5784487.1 M23 family metallopeptidase [Ramlibacter cellulosilyticus]
MHFIITDAWLAKSRAVHLSGTKLVLALLTLALVLVFLSAGLYHWVLLKGARERWPVIGSVVRFVVQDEFEQRDRFMRENLDAMARKLGDMQARMLQLEALGERVGGLAGVKPEEIKVSSAGRGGAFVQGRPLTLEEVQATLADLEHLTGERTDLLTVMESRLIDQRLKKMMVPTQNPVNAPVGSRFGWRIDPFNGRQALHTGLDFQANVGMPIVAAAGGVVVTSEPHPEYGNMVEVDHGNGVVSRYAHASRLIVKKGDLVKRGQQIALVGTTGRSTGPHLHFEVLVQGVHQDPSKFLAGNGQVPVPAHDNVAQIAVGPDHRPH